MLFEELGKLKRGWIMSSVLLMGVGILMLICPERYVKLLVATLGYGLLILATVMVLEFLSSKRVLINYVTLIGAMLIGLLGLAVLFYRSNVLQILGFAFGLFLVVEGVNELINAWMYARRAQSKGWGLLIVLAILLIISGIVIFANPWWNTPGTLMKVIGGMLLFSSVVGIVRVVLIWPFKNM